MRRHARAFTLIEVAAAMALLGLLSAMVWFSLAPSRRESQLQFVNGRIAFLDRLMRQHASQFGRPLSLRIQIDQGWIEVRDEVRQQAVSSVQLPQRHRICRLLIAGVDATSGDVSLRCSSRGHTASYALLLEGPDGHRQWFMVIGLTGQICQIRKEEDIEPIFAKLSEARPDPD